MPDPPCDTPDFDTPSSSPLRRQPSDPYMDAGSGRQPSTSSRPSPLPSRRRRAADFVIDGALVGAVWLAIDFALAQHEKTPHCAVTHEEVESLERRILRIETRVDALRDGR